MTHHPKSDFLQIMQERGFIADCTNLSALDAALLQGPVTGYIGYDATASSLHVGHLVNIMMLRWFQKTGNRPIVLLGGGTTRIGDPSFRSNQRPMMSDAEIRENMSGISTAFERLLDFEDSEARFGAATLDNADWLCGLGFIDFLREVGSLFSVNRMLSFESVKSRLDRSQSLSLLEFNYMVLQAFDFLELNRRTGCTLQMGGSDQWGNIVNGIDLTRRVAGKEVFGLTTPLLETSDGKKMGKSEGGAIWLNPDKLPAYDFWQFWRNISDADVARFLPLFTELPMEECQRLAALGGAEINEAKIILANEVTGLLHGKAAAEAAEATAAKVFAEGGMGQDLPRIDITDADLAAGLTIVQLLTRAGFAASGKAAKRLVIEGGARLGDTPIRDISFALTAELLADPLRLSAGKKRHAIVRRA